MAANTKPETMAGSASQLPRLPHLAHSILQFYLSDELAQLRQEDSWQRGTGRSLKTLAKHPDFRIVLTLIKPMLHVNAHRTEASKRLPHGPLRLFPTSI